MSNDLVRREDTAAEFAALLSRINGMPAEYFHDAAKLNADRIPAAEPKRETGEWIDAEIPTEEGSLQIQACSECNTFYPLAYTGGGHRYCPSCGARMKLESDIENPIIWSEVGTRAVLSLVSALYQKNLAKGMDESQADREADEEACQITGLTIGQLGDIYDAAGFDQCAEKCREVCHD